MSERLTSGLDEADARDLRRATRALPRRPLLLAREDPETFRIIRQQASTLREWFEQNIGWRLHVDAEVARLLKRTGAVPDGTHPAREPRSGLPFGRRRYVLVCLALSVLERADQQITLGRLAEGIIAAASDERLARAGVTFELNDRGERGDLVAVMRILLALGVLARVAGDEEAFMPRRWPPPSARSRRSSSRRICSKACSARRTDAQAPTTSSGCILQIGEHGRVGVGIVREVGDLDAVAIAPRTGSPLENRDHRLRIIMGSVDVEGNPVPTELDRARRVQRAERGLGPREIGVRLEPEPAGKVHRAEHKVARKPQRGRDPFTAPWSEDIGPVGGKAPSRHRLRQQNVLHTEAPRVDQKAAGRHPAVEFRFGQQDHCDPAPRAFWRRLTIARPSGVVTDAEAVAPTGTDPAVRSPHLALLVGSGGSDQSSRLGLADSERDRDLLRCVAEGPQLADTR